ncbi:hypothetical protein Ddye_028641 [Dipteronia dyeriana]|uniref:Uncharacterized protein n=1 Tax=Dipteronia dyeriana TaxID=168575 RepID=A0AAD9TCY0_9ROSI|nr:hypothetical protein Ddye_028641 [Dipteronia dyeriana]
MATKKISTGVIAMFLVTLILSGGSADAAVAPEPAAAPSTVFYKVGMPLYRVRDNPDVLIPASKLDPKIPESQLHPQPRP